VECDRGADSRFVPLDFGPLGHAGPLGRCALVYVDDCLIHSPTREKHLLDVAEVLEIFRHSHLLAKSSKCELRGGRSLASWGTASPRTVCRAIRARCNRSSSKRRRRRARALGSPPHTAGFAWSPEAQASYEALQRVSAQVLRTFGRGDGRC
jgi:hypothetical protein